MTHASTGRVETATSQPDSSHAVYRCSASARASTGCLARSYTTIAGVHPVVFGLGLALRRSSGVSSRSGSATRLWGLWKAAKGSGARAVFRSGRVAAHSIHSEKTRTAARAAPSGSVWAFMAASRFTSSNVSGFRVPVVSTSACPGEGRGMSAQRGASARAEPMPTSRNNSHNPRIMRRA
jgi:hypothetical protein